MDPDGRIQRNAKHKSATKDASPEEHHLADVLKEVRDNPSPFATDMILSTTTTTTTCACCRRSVRRRHAPARSTRVSLHTMQIPS